MFDDGVLGWTSRLIEPNTEDYPLLKEGILVAIDLGDKLGSGVESKTTCVVLGVVLNYHKISEKFPEVVRNYNSKGDVCILTVFSPEIDPIRLVAK